MAEPYLTKALRQELFEGVSAVFMRRIDAVHKKLYERKLDFAASTALYDALFGEHRHAMEALPEAYFRMTDSFRVGGIGNYDCDFMARLPQPLRFPASPSFTLPERFYATAYTALSYVVYIYAPEIAPRLYDEVSSAHAERGLIQRRQFKACEELDSLFSALPKRCSVRRLLSVCPALFGLLPPEVQSKVRTLPQQDRSLAPVNVDVDFLTAELAIDRLTRGV